MRYRPTIYIAQYKILNHILTRCLFVIRKKRFHFLFHRLRFTDRWHTAVSQLHTINPGMPRVEYYTMSMTSLSQHYNILHHITSHHRVNQSFTRFYTLAFKTLCHWQNIDLTIKNLPNIYLRLKTTFCYLTFKNLQKDTLCYLVAYSDNAITIKLSSCLCKNWVKYDSCAFSQGPKLMRGMNSYINCVIHNWLYNNTSV